MIRFYGNAIETAPGIIVPAEHFREQTICLTGEMVTQGRPALLRRCRDVDRQAQCGSGHLHDTRGSHFALG
jgi:hypothetical protein